MTRRITREILEINNLVGPDDESNDSDFGSQYSLTRVNSSQTIFKDTCVSSLVHEFNSVTQSDVHLSIYTDNIQTLRRDFDRECADVKSQEEALQRLKDEYELMNRAADTIELIKEEGRQASRLDDIAQDYNKRIQFINSEAEQYAHVHCRTDQSLNHFRGIHEILVRQIKRMNKRLFEATQLKKQSWLEYDVSRRKLQRTKESLGEIQLQQLNLLKERTFGAEETRKSVESEMDRYVRKKNIDVRQKKVIDALKSKAIEKISRHAQKMQTKISLYLDAGRIDREIQSIKDTFGTLETEHIIAALGRVSSTNVTLNINVENALIEKSKKEQELAHLQYAFDEQRHRQSFLAANRLTSATANSKAGVYIEGHSENLAHTKTIRNAAQSKTEAAQELMRQVVDGLYHIQATLTGIDTVRLFGPHRMYQVFCDQKGEAQLDQLGMLLMLLAAQLGNASRAALSRQAWIDQKTGRRTDATKVNVHTVKRLSGVRGKSKKSTILEGKKVFQRHFVPTAENESMAKTQELAESLARDYQKLEMQDTGPLVEASPHILSNRLSFDLRFSVVSDSEGEDENGAMLTERQRLKRYGPALTPPPGSIEPAAISAPSTLHQSKSKFGNWERRIQSDLNVFDKNLQSLNTKTKRMNLRVNREIDIDRDFQRTQYQLSRMKEDFHSTKSSIGTQYATRDSSEIRRVPKGKTMLMTPRNLQITPRSLAGSSTGRSSLKSVGMAILKDLGSGSKATPTPRSSRNVHFS